MRLTLRTAACYGWALFARRCDRADGHRVRQGGIGMRIPRMMAPALVLVALLGVAAASSAPAWAQGQTIKIGTLYDHSGPFSAAGSLNCWRGAKMMIDYINEKGGVLGKYKIVQVDGDSQSKPTWRSTRPSGCS